RLAWLSGEEARAWDLRSGQEVDRWQLPEGLGDHMVFDAHGHFLTARFEDAESGAPPRGRARAGCVCRIRRLLPGGAMQTVLDVTEFEDQLSSVILDPRGRYVVVDGVSAVTGARRRAVSC